MTRAASRRGLVFAGVILLLLLFIADILRPNSLLRSFFGSAAASRQEGVLDGIERRSRPLPDRIGLVIPGEVRAAQKSLSA